MTEPAKSRLEKLETLARVVLSVVLSLCALAGGAWAFSEFWLTRQMSRSALELRQLELELRQLERAQREASAFESTLEARQVHPGGEGGCAVAGEVGFRNRGAKPIRLDYRESAPLMVGRTAVADGKFTFREVALHPFALPHHPDLPYGPDDAPAIGVGTLTLAPGRPLEIPFLIPVPSPGLYMVLLRPERSDRWWPEGGSAAAAPVGSLVWLNAVLVEVEAGRGCA